MESPKHLQHTPIISVNDYDKIDGHFAEETDVRALSIGFAQYGGEKEISLKVWRHTGEKWSRQSEELPVHRNLDLSILFIAALLKDTESNYPDTNLREEIDNKDGVNDIKKYYENNKKYLKPRLEELKDKLDEFLKSQ